MFRSFVVQVLVPRQPISSFTSFTTQQITQIKPNLTSPVMCRNLHVSTRSKLHSKNKKKKDEDPFLIMRENKNLNLGLNPTLHQQTVNDGSIKRGKVLNVAILGVPNSGKSTLINQIVGKEVCPYSCKHNTTRKKSRAILTVGDTQLVFLDTPGLVSLEEMKRFKLEESLYLDPEISCNEADLLLVIQDASNRYVREAIDKKVLRLLVKYHHKVPSILVLNKMDIMPRKRLVFDLIQKLTCNRLNDVITNVVKTKQNIKENVSTYIKKHKKGKQEEGEGEEEKNLQMLLDECGAGPVTDARADELTKGLIGWPGFRDVFCIVAKKGEGVSDLKNYIMKNAKTGGHRYNSALVHDQDPREFVVNTVKSKLLENLKDVVPFRLQPVIEMWQYDADVKTLHIVVSIDTKKSWDTRVLIGENGETINLLANQIEASLMDYFETIVKLKLEAKVSQAEENRLSFDKVNLKPDPRNKKDFKDLV